MQLRFEPTPERKCTNKIIVQHRLYRLKIIGIRCTGACLPRQKLALGSSEHWFGSSATYLDYLELHVVHSWTCHQLIRSVDESRRVYMNAKRSC